MGCTDGGPTYDDTIDCKLEARGYMRQGLGEPYWCLRCGALVKNGSVPLQRHNDFHATLVYGGALK